MNGVRKTVDVHNGNGKSDSPLDHDEQGTGDQADATSRVRADDKNRPSGRSTSKRAALARQIAEDAAEDSSQVGDFVKAIELERRVSDFRFTALIPGYEGWQWSVILYHDVERRLWTVDETSLVPAEGAILPPPWVPWKNRLKPEDIAVSDVLGTEADDGRLEDGFRPTGSSSSAAHDASARRDDGIRRRAGTGHAEADQAQDEDLHDAVDRLALSRRHVMTPLGRSQTAKRWYEGQHGPRSLSTKAAQGHVCEDCGFLIPLRGELGVMFGVCANRWSPDDGRVVSMDHGCGEHSEIEPPEPAHLWEQSEPAFDDLHVDLLGQVPSEDNSHVELIEKMRNGQATDE